MPIYHYYCKTCQKQYKLLVDYDTRNCTSCPIHNEAMGRYFDPIDSEVRILASRHTGRAVLKNTSKILKERTRKHSRETIGKTIEQHGLEIVKNTESFKASKKNLL